MPLLSFTVYFRVQPERGCGNMKGLSNYIKKLIVKLHQGIPLTPGEDEFCLDLKKELTKQ